MVPFNAHVPVFGWAFASKRAIFSLFGSSIPGANGLRAAHQAQADACPTVAHQHRQGLVPGELHTSHFSALEPLPALRLLPLGRAMLLQLAPVHLHDGRDLAEGQAPSKELIDGVVKAFLGRPPRSTEASLRICSGLQHSFRDGRLELGMLWRPSIGAVHKGPLLNPGFPSETLPGQVEDYTRTS